ncbi:MAG: hypothetical protein EOO39_02035, partial [Cytophagaceae bacterium]
MHTKYVIIGSGPTGLGAAYRLNELGVTDFVVLENGSHHIDNCVKVRSVLYQVLSSVVDKVLEGRKHVFQVKLGARFERLVDQLERLPHSRRDSLGGEGAAVDDFEYFVVEIVKLVLQGDGDDGHKDGFEVCEDVRCAFESQDKSSDGLEHTEGGDALVVKEVTVVAFTLLGVVALDEFTDDSEVGVTKLLAESNGKWCQLGGEDLDKILHHVCESIDIDLVRKLEQLLHDLRDVLLHHGPDGVVSDQRLERERRLDSHGQSRVGHGLEDVAVDDDKVVRVLE